VDLTSDEDDLSDLVIEISEGASVQDAKPHTNSEESSMLNAGPGPDRSSVVTNTNSDILKVFQNALKPLSGRRLFDVKNLFTDVCKMALHNTNMCSFYNFIFVREVRRGLYATFEFECSMCKLKMCVRTEEESPEGGVHSSNYSAVSGALAIGIGRSQASEFLGSLSVPFVTQNTYHKYEQRVSDKWIETAFESMKVAAQEEKNLAVQENRVDANGTPKILVTADGAWSKRSYGHNYSAPSGLAAIVGYRSGKILFMSVRNRFCAVCAYAKRKKKLPETMPAV